MSQQPPQPGQQPYYPPPTGPIPPQVSGPVYPPGYVPPSQPVPPGYGWPQGYAPPSQQYPMQYPYQPPPYYPYQQPGWPPMPRRVNHHAELAQTFGILSLFLGIVCGIPAIIFGVMAQSEIQRTGEDGMSKANTGLLLGILSFVWVVVYYYWFIVPR